MRQVALLLLIALAVLGCDSTNAESGMSVIPDTASAAPLCRTIDTPWVEGTPLRLPCVRTEEPCDGIDNDSDGIIDPHCPTRTCTSDADCTLGGVILDTDCCVRVCRADDCGEPDGCGGTCPCDGSVAVPVCTQIDGWPRTGAPMKCQGVLCPPGLKCVEGDCVTPGTHLPGQQCDSGRDCALTSGCVPFDPTEPPRCLSYCNETPCPTGYVCSYQEYPTDAGFPVIHETCRQPGLCERGRKSCSAELSACYGDSQCVLALECAETECLVDRLNRERGDDSHEDDEREDDDSWDDVDPACLANCLQAQDTALATAFAQCINTICDLESSF